MNVAYIRTCLIILLFVLAGVNVSADYLDSANLKSWRLRFAGLTILSQSTLLVSSDTAALLLAIAQEDEDPDDNDKKQRHRAALGAPLLAGFPIGVFAGTIILVTNRVYYGDGRFRRTQFSDDAFAGKSKRFYYTGSALLAAGSGMILYFALTDTEDDIETLRSGIVGLTIGPRLAHTGASLLYAGIRMRNAGKGTISESAGIRPYFAVDRNIPKVGVVANF